MAPDSSRRQQNTRPHSEQKSLAASSERLTQAVVSRAWLRSTASARPSSTPLDLDRATLRELTRVLAERLAQLDAFGGKCPTCNEAEARAFLARPRRLLATIERGGLEEE